MYVPTPADVITAFATAETQYDRPLNLTDLSMLISTACDLPWRTDRPVVSQTVLRKILDEMVADGQVALERGGHWREMGKTFLHQRDLGWYYGRPQDVKRWQEAAAATAEAALLVRAQEAALLVLRDRHRDEYEQIVNAEHDKLHARAAAA